MSTPKISFILLFASVTFLPKPSFKSFHLFTAPSFISPNLSAIGLTNSETLSLTPFSFSPIFSFSPFHFSASLSLKSLHASTTLSLISLNLSTSGFINFPAVSFILSQCFTTSTTPNVSAAIPAIIARGTSPITPTTPAINGINVPNADIIGPKTARTPPTTPNTAPIPTTAANTLGFIFPIFSTTFVSPLTNGINTGVKPSPIAFFKSSMFASNILY